MTAENQLRDKNSEFLSTLQRGLSVLRAFSGERPQMMLSEVAAATGLNPAVARRCLHTLAELGYVARNGRRFQLRPRVLEFADAYLTSANMTQAIMPYLQQLSDESGDSASMAVQAGNDAMYIAHVPTARQIRLGAHAGTRFPLHATSLGKTLLAFAPEAEVTRYLSESQRTQFTQETLTTESALRGEFEMIRKQGFASARDELDYGITSAAVPVFDRKRKIVAAINCSTASSRVAPGEFERNRVPLLREVAGQIEHSLARYPTLAESLG